MLKKTPAAKKTARHIATGRRSDTASLDKLYEDLSSVISWCPLLAGQRIIRIWLNGIRDELKEGRSESMKKGDTEVLFSWGCVKRCHYVVSLYKKTIQMIKKVTNILQNRQNIT